jgi:GntR family transcriptional regulator, galactonate operon transcriptional repressor
MIRLVEMSTSIRREPLHEQVTRALAIRILGGTLAVDSSSSTELELCRELGVSRTVLREAIKVLAAKGLVEVRPKTGVRVKPRSEWSLLDPTLLMWQTEFGVDEKFVRNLCQVRLLLEPPTAAAAATTATDEERKAIYRAWTAMEGAQLDFSVFVEADYEFHSSISRASHNDFLIQINRIVFDALRGTQSVHKKRRDPVGATAALGLHRAVAEAIRRRNPNGARDAMIKVIQRAEQDIYFALYQAPSALRDDKATAKSLSS